MATLTLVSRLVTLRIGQTKLLLDLSRNIALKKTTMNANKPMVACICSELHRIILVPAAPLQFYFSMVSGSVSLRYRTFCCT